VALKAVIKLKNKIINRFIIAIENVVVKKKGWDNRNKDKHTITSKKIGH
jgi:hypothetical protein